MKNFILGFLLFCMLPSFVLAQKGASDLKTIELVSVFDEAASADADPRHAGCYSFVFEIFNCRSGDLTYGRLRAGEEWDWFEVTGTGRRNKLVNLGKLDWTDNFKIPVVEPYPTLKAGERRKITVDTSGRDGKDGAPGRDGLPGANADESRPATGTYPDLSSVIPEAPLRPPARRPRASDKDGGNQVVVKNKDDDYEPLHKVIAGNMYVLRVVDDENNDFYVLFRVNSLERGRKVTISWKTIDAPKVK